VFIAGKIPFKIEIWVHVEIESNLTLALMIGVVAADVLAERPSRKINPRTISKITIRHRVFLISPPGEKMVFKA
jgi:hypothetical protein